MHPNHYTKVQHLLSEDYAPRLELQEHEENPGFLANVLLTDESYFCRKGTFNSHNLSRMEFTLKIYYSFNVVSVFC
jgi:hypothetical protein